MIIDTKPEVFNAQHHHFFSVQTREQFVFIKFSNGATGALSRSTSEICHLAIKRPFVNPIYRTKEKYTCTLEKKNKHLTPLSYAEF